MKLPVEDDFNDVIGKAQKGQGITTETLSERTGVTEEGIRKARRGDFNETTVGELGKALKLNVPALIAIGKNEWYPSQPDSVIGFELIATPFYSMHVNAYLLWDEATREAIAFDTGTDATPMLQRIDLLGLKLKRLYLTHSHGDHIEGASEIMKATGASAVISRLEPDMAFEAEKVDEGFVENIGRMRIEMFNTPGHTPGGGTFVVSGLSRSFAIAGDAIFAGSMGGANVSYDQGMESVKRILSLPDDTIIASGHGPLTTVAQEKSMNCFCV
ncbi:MAG: hydroxyacylglutathione hydrolase [Candidatus Pelagisphaera sp.]|jgi:hydroxyacylglutathione hydrolase